MYLTGIVHIIHFDDVMDEIRIRNRLFNRYTWTTFVNVIHKNPLFGNVYSMRQIDIVPSLEIHVVLSISLE